MIKRIDFLGAPGVGKSTIYSTFIKENRKSCISEGKAILLAGMEFSEKFPVLTSLILKGSLAIPGLQNVLLNNFQLKTSRQNLQQSVDKYKSFYEVVENIYCKINNPTGYRKFQGYIGFLNKMKSLEFLENYSIKENLILNDESISQKVYGLYGIRSIDKEDLKFIQDYFSVMPLPSGLIYVYSDVNNIISNINKRELTKGYLIPGHEGIDLDDLKKRTECALVIANIGYETLKKREVPTIKLKSTDPIDTNVDRIKHFLKQVI